MQLFIARCVCSYVVDGPCLECSYLLSCFVCFPVPLFLSVPQCFSGFVDHWSTIYRYKTWPKSTKVVVVTTAPASMAPNNGFLVLVSFSIVIVALLLPVLLWLCNSRHSQLWRAGGATAGVSATVAPLVCHMSHVACRFSALRVIPLRAFLGNALLRLSSHCLPDCSGYNKAWLRGPRPHYETT